MNLKINQNFEKQKPKRLRNILSNRIQISPDNKKIDQIQIKLAMWKQYNTVKNQFSKNRNKNNLNRFPLSELRYQQKNLSIQLNQKNKMINEKSKAYLQGLFQNNKKKCYNFFTLKKKNQSQKKMKRLIVLNLESKRQKFPTQNKMKSSRSQSFKIHKQSILKIPKKKQQKPQIKQFLSNLKINSFKFECSQFLQIRVNKINDNNPFETRRGGCLFKYLEKYIVFGGFSKEVKNNIEIFYADKNITESMMDFLFMRSNYLSIKIENAILIHGGYTSEKKRRQFMSNDLFTFNMANNDLKIIQNYSDENLFRVDHCGFLWNNNFYILGGENKQNKIENQMVQFNLLTNESKKIKIDNFTEKLTKAKCVQLGNHNSQKFFNIFNLKYDKLNFIRQRNVKKKEFYQRNNFTVYFFGGINEQQNYTNLLRKLEFDENTWKMSYPQIQGKVPSPRIEFGFEFFKTLESLLIVGGKGQSNQKIYKQEILNDMHLFIISKNTFVQIRTQNQLLPRFDFSIYTEADSIMIFGGQNNNNFIDGIIYEYKLNTVIKKKNFLEKNCLKY